jgi:hypothetical protein
MMRRLILCSVLVAGCNIDEGRPSREEIHALKAEPPIVKRYEVEPPKSAEVVDLKDELEKALKRIDELEKKPLQQVAPPDDRVEKLQERIQRLESRPQAKSDTDRVIEAIVAEFTTAVETSAENQKTALFFEQDPRRCRECPKLWRALEPEFASRKVVATRVELEKEEATFEKFGVKGTPTVIIYSPYTQKVLGRVEGNSPDKVTALLDDKNTFGAIPIGTFNVNKAFQKLAGKTMTFGDISVIFPADTAWTSTYKDGVRDVALKSPIKLELHKLGTWSTTLTGVGFTTDSGVVRLDGLLVPDIRAGFDWSVK